MAAGGEKFTLHVFRIEDDGGLGNACLLELPDGRVGVVDWGTQHPESLRHALEIICDARVAFVAATHAHADHTLGIALLLEEVVRRGMRVERFAYPASTLNKKQAWLTRARQKAKDLGIPTSAVTVDDFQGSRGYPDPPCLAWGAGWDVRVLSPAATMVAGEELGALRREQVAGNVTSMVILFRFDDRGPMGRVLLTGDATKATLDFAATTAARFPELSLRNECLVVPHHGARGGVPPWLFDLSEGAIVISGKTSGLHHPSRDTLMAARSRCATSGGDIFCTSYALACREEFAAAAVLLGAQHLVQPGRCFGDLAITVPRTGKAQFAGSSDRGDDRRHFGFCRAIPRP